MKAFIINLELAHDRWANVVQSIRRTHLTLVRVPGIDGYSLQLPIPEYAERNYRLFHGRPTNLGAVGCYLSHLEAMRQFLDTGEPHALIGEDDLSFGTEFDSVLESALEFREHWNILRLTGLSPGPIIKLARLHHGYSLCINFTRLKGIGAYVVDRKAASALISGLLPMWLPIDHALDREWMFCLRAASVFPFPASQLESGFPSSIQRGESLKLGRTERWFATYPYQSLIESSRFVTRSWRCLEFLFKQRKRAANAP